MMVHGKYLRIEPFIAFFAETATDENNKVEQQRAYATIGRVYLLQAQSNPTDAEAMKLLKRAEKHFLESLLICKK